MGRFEKGFIEIGVLPVPSYLAVQANYVTVDAAPIDGIVINLLLNDGDELRSNTIVNESYTMADLSASLSYINIRNELGWGVRVKNNFVMSELHSLSGTPIDWFSTDIEHVINNFSLFAEFTAAAKLSGIFFDAEGYTPMWDYTQMPENADHTFAEYEARVKQAGNEIALNWLRAQPEIQVIFTVAYMAYVDSPPPETSSYGLYKAFLDGVHDAFGVTNDTVIPKNNCCKEWGTTTNAEIILTTESTYACLNQDCLEDALEKVDGRAGDAYKGGSDYFGLVDNFGLALWITTPGALFDCADPMVNHYTPEGFKSVLSQLMARAGIGWIYDPLGANCTFYGGPLLDQDYVDKIFEVRAAYGLP